MNTPRTVPDFDIVDHELAAELRQLTGVERIQIGWELFEIYRRDLTAYLAQRHPEWPPEQLEREVAQRIATSEEGPREPGVLIPSARPLILARVETKKQLGAEAMRGFARRIRSTPRTTSDWMSELREGEG